MWSQKVILRNNTTSNFHFLHMRLRCDFFAKTVIKDITSQEQINAFKCWD